MYSRFHKFQAYSFFLLIVAVLASTPVSADTWNSDWGPIQVQADGQTFVARYNHSANGIIVMRNQGGGNYSGYFRGNFYLILTNL